MRGVDELGELGRLVGSPYGIGALLAATGLITWTSVSLWGGVSAGGGLDMRQAWETPAYFYFGLPVMVAAVAAAAFLFPDRPWRWALWLACGHQLGVFFLGIGMQSGLSLVLVTAILGVMLAVGFAVPAMLGAMLGRAMNQRAY